MTSELCYTAEQLQKGIILDIPKDFYVLWEYTTQAAYEILLKMTDKNTQNIYMDEKRRSIEIEPFCHGIIEKVISDGVELCIDIPETRATFDCRVSKLEIKNATDDLLAISYTIMVEDGCDEDYNDLLLHVTAWKYKF